MATNPTKNLGMQNWFSTTLSQSCGSTDTTLYVTNTPSVTEGYLIIDPNNTSTREVIHFTSLGSGTVILPSTGDRGLDGTSAQSHAQGTSVVLNYTTSYYNAISNGYAFNTGALATTGIFANNILTSAQFINPVWQYLGYTQITGTITTSSTSATQATGLTTTVTVPSGITKVRVTASAGIQLGTSAKTASLSVWSGTVGSGTQLNSDSNYLAVQNVQGGFLCQAIYAPSAGSITYNVGWSSDGGGGVTATMEATSTTPAFILVECC